MENPESVLLAAAKISLFRLAEKLGGEVVVKNFPELVAAISHPDEKPYSGSRIGFLANVGVA